MTPQMCDDPVQCLWIPPGVNHELNNEQLDIDRLKKRNTDYWWILTVVHPWNNNLNSLPVTADPCSEAQSIDRICSDRFNDQLLSSPEQTVHSFDLQCLLCEHWWSKPRSGRSPNPRKRISFSQLEFGYEADTLTLKITSERTSCCLITLWFSLHSLANSPLSESPHWLHCNLSLKSLMSFHEAADVTVSLLSHRTHIYKDQLFRGFVPNDWWLQVNRIWIDECWCENKVSLY